MMDPLGLAVLRSRGGILSGGCLRLNFRRTNQCKQCNHPPPCYGKKNFAKPIHRWRLSLTIFCTAWDGREKLAHSCQSDVGSWACLVISQLFLRLPCHFVILSGFLSLWISGNLDQCEVKEVNKLWLGRCYLSHPIAIGSLLMQPESPKISETKMELRHNHRWKIQCNVWALRMRSSELNFQRNSVFNLSQLFASQHYCKHCGTDQEKEEDDSGETQDGEERPRRRTPTQWTLCLCVSGHPSLSPVTVGQVVAICVSSCARSAANWSRDVWRASCPSPRVGHCIGAHHSRRLPQRFWAAYQMCVTALWIQGRYLT